MLGRFGGLGRSSGPSVDGRWSERELNVSAAVKKSLRLRFECFSVHFDVPGKCRNGGAFRGGRGGRGAARLLQSSDGGVENVRLVKV